MHAALFNRFRQSFLRRVMVWGLVWVLPIHGLSGTVLHLLGPQHRHALAANGHEAEEAWTVRAITEHFIGKGAMDIIDGFHARQQRQGHQRLVVRSDFYSHVQALDKNDEAHQHAHTHSHNVFERHRHDPNDGSVIAIGLTESGQDGPGTTVGGLDFSGSLPLPITSPYLLAAATAKSVWAIATSRRWHSHVSVPPERPPRF